MIIPKNPGIKKNAVMGLGKSGMATLASLKAAGAYMVAWDDSEESRRAAQHAGYPVADLRQENWAAIGSLILSPGIPHTWPQPHPVAALAKQHRIEIIGDVELFFRAHPDAYSIGITGTNGKSTTTALIAHILKSAGKNMQVGGNLGIPVLSFHPPQQGDFTVIEMSSFQCELTPSAAFDIAVWLNITPDHIDRHGDLAGYIGAKEKMLRKVPYKKQTLIIGIDDDHSAQVADAHEKEWHTIRISSQKILKEGVSAVDGLLYKNAVPVFSLINAHTLPGAHNAQNACAAFAACHIAGLDSKTIENGINNYPGLPHRQQLIRTINGIAFINDSKATNADATSKALSCYKNIYWIVGGKAKKGGLNGLETLMPNIRHAFLIGASSDEFGAWLRGKASATSCDTLDNALQAAAAMAAQEKISGAVVLLSPACASYDQFNNYEHRGEEFARMVREL